MFIIRCIHAPILLFFIVYIVHCVTCTRSLVTYMTNIFHQNLASVDKKVLLNIIAIE